jgi:hypothetical protein
MSMMPNAAVTPDGHEWVPSTLGHGDYQCKWCLITNREAHAIGELDKSCPNRPKSAVAVQIGGNHYKQMAIQPLELGYANQYDAPIYSAIKYVSRHRAKDGLEGLKKARHCVQFALEMLTKYGHRACLNVIPMEVYIEKNGFTGLEALILMDLHVFSVMKTDFYDPGASLIVQKINALIAEAYGAENV